MFDLIIKTIFECFDVDVRRITRKQYWITLPFVLITSYFLYFAAIMTFSNINTAENVIFIIYLLLFFVNIQLGVKRIHDVGFNGWILIIPIVNILTLLSESNKFKNQWGWPRDDK